jgi:acyl-CoA synthetase (AMP-forming)/AMP-acid ligase II
MTQSSDERRDDPALANTLPRFVRDAAAAYGDDVAITFTGETLADDSISFSELERQSAILARGLVARGVGKGTRIGFIQCNGPMFAVLFAAIARTGAIAVPISTMIRANELVRVLRQSDIAGLVVHRAMLGKDYVQRLCEALPALETAPSPELRLVDAPYLRWIVSSGESLPPAFRDLQWLQSGAESVDDELLLQIESEIYPTDQLLEIYTSGSMALPKGVKHNHGPVMRRTHYVREKVPTIQRGETLPSVLPMFWIGGLLMNLLANWEAGAVTACFERTLSDSRMAMGSVLADDDLEAMSQMPTKWALGMTETIGPYSYGDVIRVPGYPLCPPLDHIADGFEVRVVDENDRPVADGKRGEIQVRGYALTPGLHKIEREEHFTPDGFLRTGDMGVVEGSRIHFVGRDGDVIKTAGSNVSPAEVELEMQQLEGVHSAYVLGVPDEERGQLLVAAVVPRDGASLEVAVLRDTLMQRLSSYKVPREYVVLTREEVPMLHSNKVARRELARLVADRLSQA